MRVIVSCLLLAASGFACLAQDKLAGEKSRTDFLWGANGHPFAAYHGISFETQLDLMRDAGLKSYRVDIGSIDQIPRLKILIQLGKTRGIEILPVITPALKFEGNEPKDLRNKAYELAYRITSAVRGDVSVIELGNELENYAIIQPCEMQDNGVQYNCSWGPAGGVGKLEYFGPRWAKVSAILKGLSEGTRAADPAMRRAMGTAGWGHVGAFLRMEEDRIDWDISVWHMYGEDPEWAFKTLAKFGKPIWVTELNHPYGSRESERAQADGILRWMNRLPELQSQYKVEAAHIYELLDEPYWLPSYEAVMGLVFVDKHPTKAWQIGKPKMAYQVVKAFLADELPKPLAPPVVVKTCDLKKSARDDRIASEIAYAYCLLLDRMPDGGGLASWSRRRQSELTSSELLVAIMGSDEFHQRFNIRKLSDSAFITLVHRLLLERDPEWSGYLGLLDALGKKTVSREQVIAGLLASGEFGDKHIILRN